MIAANLVLTCAHNIYDRKRKAEGTGIKFTPGLNGKKGISFSVKKLYYPSEYK